MKGVRSKFETTSALIVYREQADGFADDPHQVPAGAMLFAAHEDGQTRMLEGRRVPVVLFTLGELLSSVVSRHAFQVVQGLVICFIFRVES
jgi:hypothetical protein